MINVVALGFFFKSATAKYDAEGSLVDPGQDLSLKGLMDFVWDFIYVTWFCQIATLFSAWLWLLMLVVRPSTRFSAFHFWFFLISVRTTNGFMSQLYSQIPIYGAIKLIGFARSMGGMGQPPQAEPEAPTKRSRATKEPTKMKFVKGSR